jgi:hypothetical protein
VTISLYLTKIKISRSLFCINYARRLAMTPKVDPDELVTAADIGRRLNVSAQRAHQLTQQKRFPKPIGRIGNSEVWAWPKIERWSREREKERWIADAVALVPRTGGILQSKFRAALQMYLANALGSKPAMPGASVAEVASRAMEGLGGIPRFDQKLLSLKWPDLSSTRTGT